MNSASSARRVPFAELAMRDITNTAAIKITMIGTIPPSTPKTGTHCVGDPLQEGRDDNLS